MLAAGTARLEKFTVHVDDVCAACTFMQIVDVLSNESDVGRPRLLQFTQSQVRRVRSNGVCKQLPTPGVVEIMDAFGVSPERLGCCDVFDVHGGPDSIGISKRVQTGLARNSSARKNDDIRSFFCYLNQRQIVNLTTAASRSEKIYHL